MLPGSPASDRHSARGCVGSRLGPMEAVLAGLSRLCMRGLTATSRRIDLDDRSGGLLSAPRSVEGTALPTRRCIVTYWVSDALVILMGALRYPHLREFLRSVRFLVDETRVGRVSGHLIARLGGRFVVLPAPEHPSRLRSLREIVAHGGSCAFAVDGGGPYLEVGTGLVGLAALLGAAILPIAGRASPAFTVGGDAQLQVPFLGAHAALVVGQAIVLPQGVDRRHAADTVRAALHGLRADACDALRVPAVIGREAA